MTQIELPTTAGALGALFGAEVVGDETAPISRLAALNQAGHGTLSFFADPKYGAFLTAAEGAVLFTRSELARPGVAVTYLLVKDPQKSFAEVAGNFQESFPWKGISAQAVVDPTAEIDPTANIGPFAIVGARSRIGARTRVYPHAYIGESVVIGTDCEIHPQAVLHSAIRIGNRSQIFAGAVIGSQGFGYFRENGTGPHKAMPQIGTVVIEDDVRVGALVAIDRATLGETRVRRGTKIDEQCMIGHNCSIGEDVILCGQVGIAGSVTIENDVMIGGQACVIDGAKIGEGAQIGMASGVLTNVPAKARYSFSPAIPMTDFLKSWKVFRRLPDLAARLKRMEKSPESGDA